MVKYIKYIVMFLYNVFPRLAIQMSTSLRTSQDVSHIVIFTYYIREAANKTKKTLEARPLRPLTPLTPDFKGTVHSSMSLLFLVSQPLKNTFTFFCGFPIKHFYIFYYHYYYHRRRNNFGK